MFSGMMCSLLLLLMSVQFVSPDNIFNPGYDCKEKINSVIADIQSQMSHVIEQNAKLEDKNKLLMSKLTELWQNLNQQENTAENEHADLKQLENTSDKQHAAVKQRENIVSFTVAVIGEVVHIADGQVVPNTVVVRDYEADFNTQTSTFECTVTGYYLFMVTVLPSSGGRRMGVRLYLDGEAMFWIISSDLVDHSSSSGQVVSLCTAGQSVWVQSLGDSTTASATRTNTFSGTLLRLV